ALGSGCDTFVDLHPSSEWHALVGRLRRAKLRVGFRNSRLTDGVWTHSLRFNSAQYRALHFLQLLQTVRPFNPLQAARESVFALAQAHKASSATEIGASPDGSHASTQQGEQSQPQGQPRLHDGEQSLTQEGGFTSCAEHAATPGVYIPPTAGYPAGST